MPSLRAVLATAVLVAAGLTACTRQVPGLPGAVADPGPTPTAAIAAPPPAGADAVSATATAALQDFWRTAFPAAFGRDWTDIRSFVPVDPADASGPPPPCVKRPADLAGQAFYCPAADAVAWDATGLIPDLRNRFGAAGVLVVLAHEVGHAVQTRLGVDDQQRADPAGHPTILLEAMADCYAGVALAHFAQFPVVGLPFGPVERDDALLALAGFRDPLGVQPGDRSAHGNAFDRVSAFLDGYGGGPADCAGMTLENHAFTQRRFGSAADAARQGDLPVDQLLAAVDADAPPWFTGIAAARAPGWRAPALRAEPTGACPAAELVAQGPARFCAVDGSIVVDRAAVAPVHKQLGDYADATLAASRYGLALLAATGASPLGPSAGGTAVCLAGAYTGRLIDPVGTFSLSPGDLDEAVQVLMADDWAARDAQGAVDPTQHGFDRVSRFRTGLLDGPDACFPA